MIFGITGNIACGKSTVSKTFKEKNIPIVDGDIVAREVVVKGSKGLHQIVSAFGKDILIDGELNRAKLSSIIFSDKEALKTINDIMFPLIIERAQDHIDSYAKTQPLVGYDAALIIESGQHDKYVPLIVIFCDKIFQIQRLMKRNGYSVEESLLRINAQMTTEEKLKYADYSICTNGTKEETKQFTLSIIDKLMEKIK